MQELGERLKPFLSVGVFASGLCRDSLSCRLLLVGLLLPLVTMVYTCTAEQARQLAVNRCVMFNQLGEGAKLTLAFLKTDKST